MKNILLAIDLKENSQLLVDTAAEMAGKFSSRVWVIHIADPEPDFVGNKVGPQYIRDIREKELHHEHQLIQQYSDQLKTKGIEAEGLLIAGATVKTLINEIAKLKIDFIIVGHHKHSFFYPIFADITDTAIVKKSKVPVLTIPL